MIALALLATLVAQDTSMVLSPRVRAMIDRFPPPKPGLPSINIRFSRDSVWVGEQVELVTAAWFPRALRDRLRRAPAISAPSLTGLWSARDQQQPIPAGSVMVAKQLYDLYLAWQTVFPLGAGQIDAPPAVLTYNLPTSTAYFAPEERKSFRSPSATLVVRALPPAMVAALGTGPTARNLRLVWRGPANTVRAGSPAIVELAISGDGNLTLWPAPAIEWPAGLRVYPEPTLEHQVPAQGLISGEKRFRFTVVADSAGVLTLPGVRYPYFDPGAVQVLAATAAPLSLPILQRLSAGNDRAALTVTGAADIPIATRVVRTWWPALISLALLPVFLAGWRARRRAPVTRGASTIDSEAALRAALGAPVDAGPDHVVAALRRRGIPREDAEHVHRWLGALGRRRYGPGKAELPDPPPVMARVIARLRGGATVGILLLAFLPLHAQREGGVARFVGGDYPGAARAFERAARDEPVAAGTWRDLGTARWMARDDVGAAAAWLHAFALAPRDPLLGIVWRSATTIPRDVRATAPTIPLSRDEMFMVALAGWLIAWGAVAVRRHRIGTVAGTIAVIALGLAGGRWLAERPGRVLVSANVTMRISPHPATSAVGELAAWSTVRIERRLDNWVLVRGQLSAAGGVAALSVAGWIPAAATAPIGPLD